MRLRFSYKMQFKVLFCLNVLIIYEIGHFVNDNNMQMKLKDFSVSKVLFLPYFDCFLWEI